MIRRDIEGALREAAGYYPVVTLLGPRQSGKSTVCLQTFPGKRLVSFEPLDQREQARRDPRGLLAELAEGAILDEVQWVPDLLSYLQEEVDRDPSPGRFILTGSQQLRLSAVAGQSLAGRTAMLQLLPPSLGELRRFSAPPEDLLSVLWTGAYPRIHDRRIPPTRWLADYIRTYVERDVRQIANVTDLTTFSAFLRLLAGRTAQELNLSQLGADAGVSHNTARAWLSILEASLLVFRVEPWHTNLRKQIVKAPKIHFFDSGLVCRLLGIRTPEELRHHPLRGAVFESWVAAEIMKWHVHRGEEVRLCHYREAKGLEVDLLLDTPSTLTLVEVKSGATMNEDFLTGLDRLEGVVRQAEARALRKVLVFGGDRGQRRSTAEVVSWSQLDKVRWAPGHGAT